MLTKETWCDKLKINRPQEYYEEKLKLDITETILDIMREENINQSQLARLTGLKSQWINYILKHPSNLQLKTISKILFALNRELEIKVIKCN